MTYRVEIETKPINLDDDGKRFAHTRSLDDIAFNEHGMLVINDADGGVMMMPAACLLYVSIKEDK